METATLATMSEVRIYFGMNATEFRAEWTKLTSESKTQLRTGLGNGTFNY